MKKIFAVFLAIFAMAYFSMPAFASSTNATGESSSNGSLTMGSGTNSTSINISASVMANYYSADGTNYAADTYNPKGNGKAYGVSSGSTVITYQDVTAGDSSAIPSLKNGDSRDVTSDAWHQLGE